MGDRFSFNDSEERHMKMPAGTEFTREQRKESKVEATKILEDCDEFIIIACKKKPSNANFFDTDKREVHGVTISSISTDNVSGFLGALSMIAVKIMSDASKG